jgi:hypothetical protein
MAVTVGSGLLHGNIGQSNILLKRGRCSLTSFWKNKGNRLFSIPVVSGIGDNGHVQKEGALKELPHVVRGVDLLHLHLRVDVAVGQEVHVGVLHLWDGVLVTDHRHNIVQREEGVTLDLRVHVLPHRAAGQQLHLPHTAIILSHFSSSEPVLRIRYSDPGSGLEKIQSQDPGSGMNIPDLTLYIFLRTSYQFFGIKILKFSMRIRDLSTLDPRLKNRIRDKHPGFATLI